MHNEYSLKEGAKVTADNKAKVAAKEKWMNWLRQQKLERVQQTQQGTQVTESTSFKSRSKIVCRG
jgi:hypothetical protein